MLIGDYTMQCRKNIGLCTCRNCIQEGLEQVAYKRQRRISDNDIRVSSNTLRIDSKGLMKTVTG